MKNILNSVFLLSSICFFYTACNQLAVFEKNCPIPNNQWQYSTQPKFEFNISDTSAHYNIFLVIRHTDAYRYNNLWVNVGLQIPGGKMKTRRFEAQLGNDAKGWEGTGMDDIWEVRKQINPNPIKFNSTGIYTFSLAQIMRENPLNGIMSAGIRVEKLK